MTQEGLGPLTLGAIAALLWILLYFGYHYFTAASPEGASSPPDLGPYAHLDKLTCDQLHQEIDLLIAPNKPGGIKALELRQVLHHIVTGCERAPQ